MPCPPVGYAQASTVNCAGLSAAAYGTFTYSSVPLKPTAVFESPLSAPAAPSVGVFRYEPVRPFPLASAAVVPLDSPSRQ